MKKEKVSEVLKELSKNGSRLPLKICKGYIHALEVATEIINEFDKNRFAGRKLRSEFVGVALLSELFALVDWEKDDPCREPATQILRMYVMGRLYSLYGDRGEAIDWEIRLDNPQEIARLASQLEQGVAWEAIIQATSKEVVN